MPNTAQTSGRGMASMPLRSAAEASGFGAIVGAATVTGADGAFASGAVIKGCVFAIFAGAAGAGRSGKMLMRAVSFFGPACAAEPG